MVKKKGELKASKAKGRTRVEISDLMIETPTDVLGGFINGSAKGDFASVSDDSGRNLQLSWKGDLLVAVVTDGDQERESVLSETLQKAVLKDLGRV